MTKITRRTVLALSAAAPLALATNAQAATTHEVKIKSFKFDPKELTVAVGDKVKFTNLDGAPHTGTADDKSFNTGTLQKGQSKEVTITAGEHSYFCKFHRNMKGVIRTG